MANISKILAASTFAAEKHKDQKRKGRDGQPYINHPLEVADLLVRVGGVDDTDSIAAALLHDTVEDCDVTFEEIAEKFGETVATYVRELTDDKSLSQADRKRLQIEHAPHLSHSAKQIKLADKISNVGDISKNPPEGWSVERRREYVEWGRNVVAGLRGSNNSLEKLFDEVAEEAMKRISE